nr:hypothetical protein [uncultured Chryseobacterium sp.]
MKTKFRFTAAIILACPLFSSAQVGINTTAPRATVEMIARIPTGTTTPQIKDGLIIPNIDRARAQAIGDNTTTLTPFSTLVFVSNVATGSAAGSAANITTPGYYYFDTAALPAPGLWQPIRPTNVDLYGAQLRIPPHSQYTADFTNHSNTGYDSDNWWVISKSSVNFTTNQTARMTIVYEFQGTPFNINNLYPQLTAGNNSGFPDIYTANVVALANNGTGGKTRLTVSVGRVDSSASNWQGTFLLNVLLARKLN